MLLIFNYYAMDVFIALLTIVACRLLNLNYSRLTTMLVLQSRIKVFKKK